MSEPYFDPYIQYTTGRRRALFHSRTIKNDRMHEDYGIISTKENARKISLRRDEENNRKFILTISSINKYVDPTHAYICGLPREINNYIYSFIGINSTIIMKHSIELQSGYPFQGTNWTLLEYTVDGKCKKEEEDKKEQVYCGENWTPAMTLDNEILAYVSTLDWL